MQADNQMGMMDRLMRQGKLWEEVDKKLRVVVVRKVKVQTVDKKQEDVRNIERLDSCMVLMEHNSKLVSANNDTKK